MKKTKLSVFTIMVLVLTTGLFACTKTNSGKSLVLDEPNKLNMKKPAKPEPKRVTNKKNLPTYFFYFANWCGYCKKMAPLVQQAEEEFAGKVFFYYVDVDNERGKKIAQVYKGDRAGVPHAQFYDKEGNLLEEQVGYVSYEKLQAAMQRNFNL